MNEYELGFLKQSIEELKKSVNRLNETNRLEVIIQLIKLGQITFEEAMHDEIYRKFVENFKTDQKQPIKGKIK